MCLREACLYQYRWIFGKVPNGLWPPPLFLGKMLRFFSTKFLALETPIWGGHFRSKKFRRKNCNIFPKKGGGVKGRLELFQKFIDIGTYRQASLTAVLCVNLICTSAKISYLMKLMDENAKINWKRTTRMLFVRLANLMRGRTDYCMADWTKAMVSDNSHFTGKIKAHLYFRDGLSLA